MKKISKMADFIFFQQGTADVLQNVLLGSELDVVFLLVLPHLIP